MNEHDYNEAVKQAGRDHDAELRRLRRDCALGNNSVVVGDIVEYDGIRVLVEKIGIYQGICAPLPTCSYYGTALTTGYKPFKNGSMNTIYQNDKMTVIKAGDL